MATRKPETALAELRRFMRKNKDLEAIELLVADVNGVLRGKQIQRRDFEKTFADGFAMPGGTVLLDSQGNTVDGIGWAAEDGDPDLPATVGTSRI